MKQSESRTDEINCSGTDDVGSQPESMFDPQHTIEAFTRQAPGFAAAPQIQDAQALQLVLDMTDAGPDDVVLDVACGPGLLTCAFAEVAQRAVGIDITPAMIEQAQQLQQGKRLANVDWKMGDVTPLPWPDEMFSIVATRYALHHLAEPARVLAEMSRVCRPGGRVAVIDVALPEQGEQLDQFNRMEQLRDPCHIRALPFTELHTLFQNLGLPEPDCAHYRLTFELESLLKGSFPQEGATQTIRNLFHDSLATNLLGLNPELRGEEIWFSYPISVLVAIKPYQSIPESAGGTDD